MISKPCVKDTAIQLMHVHVIFRVYKELCSIVQWTIKKQD